MNSSNPFVSIVIPVYNDCDGLETTLRCINKQTYGNFEVIVVVTPSDGSTLSRANSLSNEIDEVSSILEERRRGPAAARNTGIEHATGGVIGFLDADIQVKDDWIETVVREMQNQDANYLTCNVEITQSSSTPGIIERYDLAMALPTKHYLEEYNFAATACLFVRRSLLDSVGKFDSRLTSSEDKEFGNRVYEAGHQLTYTRKTTVEHPPRSTLIEQIAKAKRIGRGLQQLNYHFPSRYNSPPLYSPLAYAPPNPFRIHNRMESNSYSYSSSEFISFYLLDFFLKLIQQWGRIKERFD